jgi:endoglucanase
MIELIRKLVETYGPSGYEEQIRAVILAEIDGRADDIRVDAMGNIIAWKRSGKENAPRVMFAAHMDEIGLMVSHVDEKGFLRVTNIGGVFVNTLHGHRVRFADGTIGAIGVDSEVEMTTAPSLAQVFVDVSNGSGKHPIKVGDAAGFDRTMAVNGDRIIAKSLDDRIGCAILIEVLRQLKSSPNDIAFVFSVQEEVGVRGATTAAYAVDPDVGIALDVTRTGDTPKGLKMAVELGKGPAIKVKDTGALSSPEVIALMEKAAQKAKVPYQLEVLERGGTDARAIQLTRAGVRAGCLSIPCRHIHTPSEVVDLKDVQNGVRLLLALLEEAATF